MRRRFLTALLIIAATLGTLAWIDYELILRDPRELDALVKRMLATALPEWNTSFGHVEVELPRRLVVSNLTIAEKNGVKPLCRVERAELTVALAALEPREVLLSGVEATLRRDKDGKLNLELPSSSGGGGSRFSGDVRLRVEKSHVLFEDEAEHARVLLSIDDVDVTIHPDGRIVGSGLARAGALVDKTSPFAQGYTPGAGGLVYREIIPTIEFQVERRLDGRLTVPIDVTGLELGPLLRSLLPEYVRDKIWDELNPVGKADARVTLTHDVQEGFRPTALVHPRGCAITPRNFPYPIRGITGRFEVSPFVISWEDTYAYGSGSAQLRSRGTVYIGEDKEKVTLHILVDAHDVPLDDPLRTAMPNDIRAVYERFGCEGAVDALVTIFKGPREDVPNIAAVADLGGRVAATFRDFPVKLAHAKGTFILRQGANVQVDATGDLAIGGKAHVTGRVVEGDLIHVEVDGDSIPLGPDVVAALPDEARSRVEPFRPLGGLVDVKVTVEKSDARARPRPTVDVTLRDAKLKPEPFPYRLRSSGKVRVAPRWPEGSVDGDGKKPEVDVGLDLAIEGPGIQGCVAKGSLQLASEGAKFRGFVSADADRLDLDRDLLLSLPEPVRTAVLRFSPDGALTHVRVRCRGSEHVEASADGDLLTAALREFPYRAKVDRLEVVRDGRALELRRVNGRGKSGGRFRIEGRIELPPGSMPSGAADDDVSGPLVDVGVRVEAIPVEKALLDALPAEAQDAIAKLEPRGGTVGGQVRVARAPGLGTDVSGTIALDGLVVSIHRWDERLAGFAQSPVDALRGIVRLEGDRLVVDGVTGRFRGAATSVSGIVGLGNGRAARGTAIDLVARVDGLRVDAATRDLARGEPREALLDFPVDGACDLDVALKKLGDGAADVSVRAHLLGARCAPRAFPVPFEGLEGMVEIARGEPVLVDVAGRLGKARVKVHRDAREETYAPAGAIGVFKIRATGLERAPEIEAPLDDSFRSALRKLDPAGPFDLLVDAWVPRDRRARGRFVAELRARGCALTIGKEPAPGEEAKIRFKEIAGSVRVAGAYGGYKKLDLDGAIELDHISLQKQEVTNVSGPFVFHNGVLSIGRPTNPEVRVGQPVSGIPFTAQLWGSRPRGLVLVDIEKGSYAGWFWLPDAPLAQVVPSLGKLRDGPPEEGSDTGPARGTVVASGNFFGEPERADGKGGLGGEIRIRAVEANLAKIGGVVGGILSAAGQDASVFNRMDVIVELKPEFADVKLFRLDSPTVTLAGPGPMGGKIGYDGSIQMQLLPFRSGWIFTDIIASTLVSVNVTGTLGRPKPNAIPIYSTIESVWQKIRDAISGPDEGPTAPK